MREILTRSFALSAVVTTLAIFPVAAQSINDIDVEPEPVSAIDQGPLADFGLRLAYNTDLGPVAGLRVSSNRLFGGTQSLSFGVGASEDTLRYSLFYSAPLLFGDNPAFGVRVNAAQSQGSDVFLFDSRIFSIEPRLTWQLDSTTSLAAYIGASWGEISNVDPATSILISNDTGERMRQLVGLELSRNLPGNDGALQGLSYGLIVEGGQSNTDHSYTRLVGRIGAGWAVGRNDSILLRARVRGATINTIDGKSHIGDRAILGQSSIRGFAFGGFGPRDLEVPGQPALGGNIYAIARFDAQFADLVPGERLLPGVFLDMGSLWGLDDINGGALGLDPVDDGFNLRASIGLSLEIATGVGPVTLSIAYPLERETYDNVQEVSVSFARSF
jgi:outer membrane protein insertion porin family